LLLENLTPASGRQDHTTSPSAGGALVFGAARVHRIPCLTSVTIAKRPSVWAGMAKDKQVIWVGRERKYFLIEDWTGSIKLIRFNKTAFWRKDSGGSPKPGRPRYPTSVPPGQFGADNLTPVARTS
jgi:hypothetical protein